MYKDSEKQKEANRIAAQRRRDAVKGMTIEKKGMTKSGYDAQGMTRPGDADYEGVCQEVNGSWAVVKPEPKPVKTMTRIELQQAIQAYPNDRWVNSPEHKELTARLNRLSVTELEELGYQIPAWKRAG